MSRELRFYNPGDILFQEGDPSGGLYFIQSGKVEVYRSRDGTDVLLGTLGAGEILGTLTVFNGDPRTASARAVSKVEVQYMSSSSLTSGLNKIPVWAVAIMKDTVARLKHVDELLVKSTVNEKKLRAESGSVFHHGSQLAHFCALMMRLQSREDDGIQIWPVKGFSAQAESILNLRAEYLEHLWESFVSGGLAKPIEDKKWGLVIRSPKPKVFEDFGVFTLKIAKKGTGEFLSQKLVRLVGSLVRVKQKYADKPVLPQTLFLDAIVKDSGRPVPADLIDSLVAKGLIRVQNEVVSYEAEPLQRRLVFEATCQELLESDGQMDPRRPDLVPTAEAKTRPAA
jgi:CRP/FNR family cyclic AMP-dependent transcriptional regulator